MLKLLVIDLKSKRHVILLFLLYISILIFVTFVGVTTSFPERFYANYAEVSHNFIPFNTIRNYLINFQYYNLNNWIYNTFGNILLFMPMGIILPILFTRIKGFFLIKVILFFSLAIETTQYVTRLGVFDVDDIILNTLGGYLGYFIFVLFQNTKHLFN